MKISSLLQTLLADATKCAGDPRSDGVLENLFGHFGAPDRLGSRNSHPSKYVFLFVANTGRSTFFADKTVDMELLLPFLNISENTTTTVLIVEPQLQTPWISNVSPLTGWNLAWNACLIKKEQAVVESGPLG